MESDSRPVAGVDYPRTFQEMEQWFRDEAACRDYIRRLRWPDGFSCPHCGVSGEPWMMSDELLRCRSCRGRTSLTAGTIFEGTRKPLRTWFMAMWFVTSQKNGVSALGLQRVLGLGSYETAWTWLHKLRRAMVRPGRDRLNGIVEVDETYVGRAEKGKWGREIESKAIVALAVEEDGKGVGRIRLRRVKDVSADSLLPFVQGAVVRGGDDPHRRLERVRRAQGGRLQAQGERDQRQLRSRARGDAARAHGRLALEALAARHAAGRHPAPASRLLPRRVHLPLQPPSVAGARLALPPARRAGRRRRAGDLPRHHEKSPKSGPL